MQSDDSAKNENSWARGLRATNDDAWASNSGGDGIRDDEIEIHVNLFIFYQQGSLGNERRRINMQMDVLASVSMCRLSDSLITLLHF